MARILPDFEARVVDQTYAADVSWQIQVPEDRSAELLIALNELSQGQIRIAP